MSEFFTDLKPVTRQQALKTRLSSVFQKTLNLERKIQARVLGTIVPAFVPPEAPSGPVEAPVVLQPVQLSGFFTATSQNVITFYVMTSWPMLPGGALVPLGPGWRAIGVTNLVGNIIVTKVKNEAGAVETNPGTSSESYLWSFECQTDTEQNIQNYQGVIGAVLYPPDAGSLVTNSITGILDGFYYVTQGRLVYYIRGTVPMMFGPQWSVSGLKGLKSINVMTNNFVTTPGTVKDSYAYDSYVTLTSEQVEDNTMDPVYGTVTVQQPPDQSRVIGANVMYKSDYSSNLSVVINSNIKTTGGAPLRDLGQDVKGHQPIFQDTYKDLEKEGYNAGTTYSLYAVGPQEKYTTGKDDTIWNTDYPQHTNFVCYQRYVPIQGSKFLGETITIELKPKELGDLMCNMYFTCQLPTLTNSSNIYVNQVGRALIAQCDFMINDTVVETVYDDWFFIKDQVFLDSDEQTAMFSAVNAGSTSSLSPTTTTTTICLPLEYFFCRRHSHLTKGRERLRRPYFPLCALYNQRI